MIKHVTVKYECEICHRLWDSADQCRRCESYPKPILAVGDVVLWRGQRYGDATQSIVYDLVEEVSIAMDSHRPGHPVRYTLQKDHSADDDDIRNAKHGYVNFAGGVGYAGLHQDNLYVAMRADPSEQRESVLGIIELLNRAGIGIREIVADQYMNLRELQYSLTWTGASPHGTIGRFIDQDTARLLEFISLPLTNKQALEFVCSPSWEGMRQRRPEELHTVFDLNGYLRWSILAGKNLNQAFDLISHKSPEEIIELVQEYRRNVLKGKAPYHGALFPINEDRAQGKWTKEALAWCKANGIQKPGKGRLQEIMHKMNSVGEEKPVGNNPCLTIFDGKTVIAVAANKGGVGKSTISAELAKALVSKGRKACIVDVDFYGPNQPDLFPVDDPRIKTENGKMLPHNVNGVEVFSVGHLLAEGEALTWRGIYLEPLLHMIGANLHTDAEIVILDLPPGTGDLMRAVQTLVPQARYLFVTTSGKVAVSDMTRALNALTNEQRKSVLGIVENLAGYNSDNKYLWGGSPNTVPDLCAQTSLRFLGRIAMSSNPGLDLRLKVLDNVMQQIDNPTPQNVPIDLIGKAASSLMIRAKLDDQNSVVKFTWSYDNIASFLEAPIRNLGGDPSDPQYRDELRKWLTIVYDTIGTTKKVIKEPKPTDWWADYVEEIKS